MAPDPDRSDDIDARLDAARRIVDAAAAQALGFFRDVDALEVDVKGRQDWVSNADRAVETAIRDALADAFPGDGIVGEEHGRVTGTSGHTWVIDPIDGTTSFVNGIPGWCVVLACVRDSGEGDGRGGDGPGAVIGVIRDPVADETWVAARGRGATLNGRPIRASAATAVDQGSVAVGHNLRVAPERTLALLGALLHEGGVYYRCGSGALMLVYVASGRLIGYCEPHMNAWDCLAALLAIEEAGGRVRPFDVDSMLASGGRVVAGGADVYPALLAMSDAAFGDDA